MKTSDAKKDHLRFEQKAPLNTPTDLKPEATKDITGALNEILADVFVLYLKTKNFHWHMSGRFAQNSQADISYRNDRYLAGRAAGI